VPNPMIGMIGASAGAGIYGAKKAGDAADKATAASDRAVDEQGRQFDLVREDTALARESGDSALLHLGYILGTRKAPSENTIKGLEQQIAEAEALRESTLAASKGSTGGVDARGRPTLLNSAPAGRGGRGGAVGISAAGGAQPADVSAIDENIKNLKAKLSGARKEMGIAAKYQNGDWLKDIPGYEFGMNEGVKAVGNTLSADGRSQGGKALKSLMRFGQDYASTKLDEHTAKLFTMAGYGPAGANTSAAAGQNLANAHANHAGVVGNGAYNVAGANAGAVNNAVNTGMSLWTYNDMMGKMGQGADGAPVSLMNMPQGNIPTAGIA
jgi:hypothetical protein